MILFMMVPLSLEVGSLDAETLGHRHSNFNPPRLFNS